MQTMFPPHGELRFRAGIVLVAFAVFVVGLAVYRLWPDSTNAKDEFARAHQALATLKSFRFDYADLAGARPNRWSYEISCPDREHVTIASASGDFGMWEYIRIADHSYHNTPNSRLWQPYSGDENLEIMDPRILCEKLAGGEEPGPFPPYAMLLKRGFPTPGEVKQTAAGACREWVVKVPRMGTADDSETLCLTPDSALPLYRITVTGRYSFSSFNEPISIERPRVAAPSY